MYIADTSRGHSGPDDFRGWPGMSLFPSNTGKNAFFGRHDGGDNILFVEGNVEFQPNSYPRLNNQFVIAPGTGALDRGDYPFCWDALWGF